MTNNTPKKIYLVERTDKNLGYDEYHNWIVVAKTPTEAKELCMEKSEDEGEKVWLDAKTTVIGRTKITKSQTILGDFNAG